jgi:AcrR family transcriptional regulator
LTVCWHDTKNDFRVIYGVAMPDAELKWRRRKEARPGEIIGAALEVFAAKGFADAKLDDIARRAGISKGTLYLYFETKEEMFRAVAQAAVKSHLETIESTAEAFDGPFAELAPMLLSRAAEMMSGGQLPAMARIVIGESRKFPDLARIWHDNVVARVIRMIAGLIARAQARGEVASGDPRLHAFSLIGPMVMAMLFREVFGGVGTDPPDLQVLAGQHARTALHGLLMPTSGGAADGRRMK